MHQTCYHPKSVKKAIPKGETIRYLCSNSSEDTYKEITKQLKQKLIERGYKAKELTQIINEFPHQKIAQIVAQNRQKNETAPLVIPIKFGPMCEAMLEYATEAESC